MTYDEKIEHFQKTLKGRHELGEEKNTILQNKYNRVSARMTLEEFLAKRDLQMQTLYNQYCTEKSGNRPRVWTGGHTSIDAILPILGNDILLDGTEISLIHELVEISGTRGEFDPRHVVEVVENVEALKTCLERITGSQILTIPLCQETDAMTNEMRISQLSYGREVFEASLKENLPRKGLLGKLIDTVKTMGRNSGEPVKLGEQQLPTNDEAR